MRIFLTVLGLFLTSYSVTAIGQDSLLEPGIWLDEIGPYESQRVSTEKHPTEFCSYRSINLLLGKGEEPTLAWNAGNLCLVINPDRTGGKVHIGNAGRMHFSGNWLGHEALPNVIEFTLEKLNSEQSGFNRKMHFLKVNFEDKSLNADVYVTLFTNLNESELDSLALFSYHEGQSFRRNPIPVKAANIPKYLKSKDKVYERFPEESITLGRAIFN